MKPRTDKKWKCGFLAFFFRDTHGMSGLYSVSFFVVFQEFFRLTSVNMNLPFCIFAKKQQQQQKKKV